MPDDFLDLRLRDLHFLVRLSVLGSLTATARELGLPKATASRRLSQIEARVGVPLVKRTTRNLALTTRGEALLPRARELLAVAEAARLELRSELLTGVLRVSVPVPMGRVIAGAVIARFRQRLPSVALEIKLQNHRVDLVRDGIDLAIRGGLLEDSELRSRRLGVATMRRYSSAVYRDAAAANVPLILAPGDAALLRRAGLPHGPAAVLVDDRSAVADALVWGAGMGLLPSFLGDGPESEGALVARDQAAVAELPVHALFHASQREDPRLRVLMDEIAAQLEGIF
jgi:DNA-binding transcriptional LysR family regulator